MPATLPGGRLRLLLQSTFEEVHEPDFVSETRLIRFVAFEGGHRLFGWVHLEADRLTDLLNSCAELHLEEVGIADLQDGSASFSDGVVISRSDLVAIHASGPRGDVSQWQQTRTYPVVMQSGNYLMGGHLHVVPSADPIASFRDRPPMIPLTDAWIEYWSGGERKHRSTGTIIVNRELIDWFELATESELGAGHLTPVEPARQ